MTADDVRAVLGPRWEVTEREFADLGGTHLRARHRSQATIVITALGPGDYIEFTARCGQHTGDGTTPRAALVALLEMIRFELRDVQSTYAMLTLLERMIATREDGAKAKGN